MYLFWEVQEGMSLIHLVKLLTIEPRRIMGFSSNLLEIGAEAELVLFDASKSWKFDSANISSKSSNSPFLGKELIGKVKYTISKGNIAEII